MKWRPEGWKNPFDGLPAYPTEAGERIFETIFEAGADAILEALKKDGWYLTKSAYSLRADNPTEQITIEIP